MHFYMYAHAYKPFLGFNTGTRSEYWKTKGITISDAFALWVHFPFKTAVKQLVYVIGY